jgi:uncharacterized protein (TIGR03118 family)
VSAFFLRTWPTFRSNLPRNSSGTVRSHRVGFFTTNEIKNSMKTTSRTVEKTLRLAARLASCLIVLSAITLASDVAAAGKGNHSNNGKNKGHKFQYLETDLVSDLPGVAMLQDTNLVNAWGMSMSPNSPFWISATETGRALVYSVTNDVDGDSYVTKVPLEVRIPGEGNVTGQVFNNTSGFHSNAFLFVSEDGTVSGWRSALGMTAETLFTRTGAVYKGVTLITDATGPKLLAANFAEGTVDVYDGNLNPPQQFSDPRAPAGYAPFNVQVAGGQVFVTFAKQDDEKEEDVPGPGHGLIDVFLPATGTFHRFATGTDAGGRLSEINSPWGVALAPEGFGNHGDELLVGNFGTGTIMAFEADGEFRGLLEGVDGEPVSIDGLWALAFGNGTRGGVPSTLYFTAGPDDETHGLFGSLQAVRKSHHRGQGQGGNEDDDDQGENGNGGRTR